MILREKRRRLKLSLPQTLFDALEKVRGPIPRGRFVEYLLEEVVRAGRGAADVGWREAMERFGRGPRVSFRMTLSEGVLKALDGGRGPAPRTRFIEYLLYDALWLCRLKAKGLSPSRT